MDIAERLDAAVKWCHDHAFVAGVTLGAAAVQIAHWIF
jgi:hypothetical protein